MISKKRHLKRVQYKSKRRRTPKSRVKKRNSLKKSKRKRCIRKTRYQRGGVRSHCTCECTRGKSSNCKCKCIKNYDMPDYLKKYYDPENVQYEYSINILKKFNCSPGELKDISNKKPLDSDGITFYHKLIEPIINKLMTDYTNETRNASINKLVDMVVYRLPPKHREEWHVCILGHLVDYLDQIKATARDPSEPMRKKLKFKQPDISRKTIPPSLKQPTSDIEDDGTLDLALATPLHQDDD